jgi:hypothetical protein
MYENGQFGLDDVDEFDGVIGAQMIPYAVAHGGGHRKYEDA